MKLSLYMLPFIVFLQIVYLESKASEVQQINQATVPNFHRRVQCSRRCLSLACPFAVFIGLAGIAIIAQPNTQLPPAHPLRNNTYVDIANLTDTHIAQPILTLLQKKNE